MIKPATQREKKIISFQHKQSEDGQENDKKISSDNIRKAKNENYMLQPADRLSAQMTGKIIQKV